MTRFARSLIVPLIAGAACGRNEERPQSFPPDLPPEHVKALAPPPPDARTPEPSFGPVELMQERFDRECPPTLPPRGPAPDYIGRTIKEWRWSCTVRSGPAVLRTVDADFQSGTSDNDRRLRKINVVCDWDKNRSTPPCDALAEAVGYVRDTTGMDEHNATRLIETIRRHQPSPSDHWMRVKVADTTVHFIAQLKDRSFGVMLEADPNAWARPIPIIDVELADVPSATP